MTNDDTFKLINIDFLNLNKICEILVYNMFIQKNVPFPTYLSWTIMSLLKVFYQFLFFLNLGTKTCSNVICITISNSLCTAVSLLGL